MHTIIRKSNRKTEYLYQTEKVIRLFLPFEKIAFNKEKDDERHLITFFCNDKVTATLDFCGKTVAKTVKFCNEEKGLLKAVFLCIKEISKLDLDICHQQELTQWA